MNRIAPLLLLVAALLGGIALELWPEHAEESAMPGSYPRPSPVPAGPAPVASVPPPMVAAILARPLFSPSRRPDATAAAGTETLPRLTGIIIDNDRRTALFAAAGGGKPLALNKDGRIAGFVVQRIEPGEVTLIGPGGTRSLRPAFDPALPPPVAATPGAPTGALIGIPGLPGLSAGLPNLPPAQPVAR